MQPADSLPQLSLESDRTPSGDTVRRPTSTPNASPRSPPDPDTLSSNFTDSLRAQLHLVNQRIDDVHKTIRMKDERGESPLCVDDSVWHNRRHNVLGFPDDSSGNTREWYGRLSLSSIHSFDQLVRAFEANFLTSARLKPTAASLLGMRRKEDEPSARTSPASQRRSGPSPTRTQALVAEKCEDQKHPRAEFSRGPPPGLPRKRTKRVEQVKRPRARGDPEITFKFKSEYPDHNDALVITTHITNANVRRIMIDKGSSTDILYIDAFQNLGMTNRDLIPMTSTLIGFTRDAITPVGVATLPVTFDDEPRTKTFMVPFMVVKLPSAYNVIIGQPTLNKLRAIVSTFHRSMKFPTSTGLREVRSEPR
ncbi:hypothetical protein BHE74_00016018 [Ensete ventricosum]|nr:hypothetical protein BHE74_00016018 [Ensete ventricosum]